MGIPTTDLPALREAVAKEDPAQSVAEMYLLRQTARPVEVLRRWHGGKK